MNKDFDNISTMDAVFSTHYTRYLQLHYNFIEYFSVNEISKKESPTLQALYMCELISVARYAYDYNQMIGGNKFFRLKKATSEKYKITEPTLKKYEDNFVKLGLISISKSGMAADNRNFYKINFHLVHKILSQKIDRKYLFDEEINKEESVEVINYQ